MMRMVKSLILLVLVIGIFQVNLFSVITSRVEGTVVDKDSGIPIAGAVVKLFESDEDFNDLFDWETRTDEKGYFKFDTEANEMSDYYLQCSKEGYVPFLPEYYKWRLKKEYVRETFRMFNLKEGQVKYIKVALSKGGGIVGTFFVKDSTGVSELKNELIFLRKLKNQADIRFDDYTEYKIESKKTDDDGKVKFDGIEPDGEYYIKLMPNGYWSQTIESVSIGKNEKENISLTIDCTNTATVKGAFTINDQVVYDGSVTVKNLTADKFGKYNYCSFQFQDTRYYSLKGIPPGKYRLVAEGIIDGNLTRDKVLYIEISPGETKILNFNLK